MRVLWWSIWANLLSLFVISSCRCESEPDKPAVPVASSAPVVAAGVVVDACTTEARDACKAAGCGCLNGRCSGGKCPVLNDGCSAAKRGGCASFACGCANERCSGGYCPFLHDGCSDETAKNCASYGCACVNGRCSGGACPVLLDGCTDPFRNSCASSGCGCFNEQCSGGACPEISDGCADKARSDCATFGCACWNDKCMNGSCTRDLIPPGQPETGSGGSKYPHASFKQAQSGKSNTDAVVYTPDSPLKPDASVAVLFHGLWPDARPYLYAPLAKHLARKGYAVILPLYGSTNGVHVPDIEQYAKDARTAITDALGRLKAKANVPVAYVGHGVGALTALELSAPGAADEKPLSTPKAIVLLDPIAGEGASAPKHWDEARLGKIPASVKLLIVSAEKPLSNAFPGASAVKESWQRVPATSKNLWVVLTDRQCSAANPTLCIDIERSNPSPENAVLVGISAGAKGFTGGEYALNAVDWRGYWRLTEAALKKAFDQTPIDFDPFCRKSVDPKCEDTVARDMGSWNLGKRREPYPLLANADDPLVAASAALKGASPAKPEPKPKSPPAAPR